MLLLDVYKMPIWLSLSVITSSLTIAVVASLRATRDLPATVADEPAPEAGDSEAALR